MSVENRYNVIINEDGSSDYHKVSDEGGNQTDYVDFYNSDGDLIAETQTTVVHSSVMDGGLGTTTREPGKSTFHTMTTGLAGTLDGADDPIFK